MLGKKCSGGDLLPFVNRMAVPIQQTLSLFGLLVRDATVVLLAGQGSNNAMPAYPLGRSTPKTSTRDVSANAEQGTSQKIPPKIGDM